MSVKVLLIEDELDIAKLITKMLVKFAEFTKFEVIHVEYMEDGKSLLRQDTFDCVLLDLMLPNSKGLESFDHIKDVCPECPVIIVSGFEEDGCRALRKGAQDFLPKSSLTPQILEKSISYAIERKRLQNKLEYSKERFRLLSDASFEGIVITKNGIFIDVNDQFCKMVGADTDYIIGKYVTEFVCDKDKDDVLKRLIHKYEKPYEHTARKKDGTLFPVEIHGRSLPDGLRLTAVRDMTRYKQSEKKEQIIFEELDDRIRQWRQEMTEESRIRKDTIKSVVLKIQTLTEVS